ncbi:MAG: MBL fold metallo-hydrolase [Pedosphaera sp.]|nr:MBL fold metallo-hydrolase [Pedosphaera sp.]
MNLEDHAGDVIRKARAMKNISAAAAASAAGLTEAELAAVEDAGKFPRRPDFAALAELTGLNAAKLEAFANGWVPKEVDLTTWRELRVFTTTQGGTTVNCFLVWEEVSREAALFDTGWDAAPLLAAINENQLQLRHLFITHSHPDHIAALAPVRAAHPKVRLHSSSKNAPMDQRNKPQEIVHLGGLRITYRDTPGHAEDGVTYLVGNWEEDAPHVAMVGDAIFAGSMGGAPQHGELAKQKIRDQILSLPLDTLICPGHGPLTTVGEQKANNPFFS